MHSAGSEGVAQLYEQHIDKMCTLFLRTSTHCRLCSGKGDFSIHCKKPRLIYIPSCFLNAAMASWSLDKVKMFGIFTFDRTNVHYQSVCSGTMALNQIAIYTANVISHETLLTVIWSEVDPFDVCKVLREDNWLAGLAVCHAAKW